MSDPAPGKVRKWYHYAAERIIAILLRAFFKLYGRWKIIGLENIPRSGPLIFAANHVSNLDPPVGWSAAFPVRPALGIAKVELWRNPVIAFWLDSIGTYPVRRHSADRAMMRHTLEMLEQGRAVAIFPEGTRSPDGRLHAAQPGIAYIVQKSGASVLPTALLGTFEMLPRGAKRLRRARLRVVFGKPVTFSTDAGRGEICSGVMAAIAELMTASGQPMPAPDPSDLLDPALEEQ